MAATELNMTMEDAASLMTFRTMAVALQAKKKGDKHFSQPGTTEAGDMTKLIAAALLLASVPPAHAERITDNDYVKLFAQAAVTKSMCGYDSRAERMAALALAIAHLTGGLSCSGQDPSLSSSFRRRRHLGWVLI